MLYLLYWEATVIHETSATSVKLLKIKHLSSEGEKIKIL